MDEIQKFEFSLASKPLKNNGQLHLTLQCTRLFRVSMPIRIR